MEGDDAVGLGDEKLRLTEIACRQATGGFGGPSRAREECRG
jgi:hypothetical protein